MQNPKIEFNKNGYLKSGIYEIDLETFKTIFVDSFPNSITRNHLFDNYLSYIDDLQKEVFPYFEQWIDGSFITKKTNPKDIDIVTFLDYKVYELRGESFMDRFWSFSLEKEGIDAYIVKTYPSTHELYLPFLEVESYYQNLFSIDRMDKSKGIIKLKFSK